MSRAASDPQNTNVNAVTGLVDTRAKQGASFRRRGLLVNWEAWDATVAAATRPVGSARVSCVPRAGQTAVHPSHLGSRHAAHSACFTSARGIRPDCLQA